MFTSLPDFAPRDPHSLWYTSSRNPVPPTGLLDSLHADPSNGQQSNQSRQLAQQLLERTALARLAADEQYAYRRRMNVANFGSGWLKPPGISKTLHQLREERREAEEHAEAVRREQLQQELAEAEAEAGSMPDEEGEMDDVQLDGAQDLDDEIPEAEDEYGMDSEEDEEDEEEEEEEETEGDEEDQSGDHDEEMARHQRRDATEEQEEEEEAGQQREEHQNDLIAAMVQSTNDAFREALIRGDPDGEDMYGGAEELEEEDQGHMLDEEDFTGQDLSAADLDGGDMGVDLDDEIPDAESLGGYEHTDSEAQVSSEDEDEDEESGGESAQRGGDEEEEEEEGVSEIGFAPRTAMLEPPVSPTLRGRASAAGPRTSIHDFSGLLSQDESSFMESSPAQGRWQRRG